MKNPIPAVPKGREALVVVCKACDGDSKRVRKALRDASRARFGKRAVRVVASSCLDLYPNHAVAVGCAAGGTVRYAIVPPKTDAGAVLDLLALAAPEAAEPSD